MVFLLVKFLAVNFRLRNQSLHSFILIRKHMMVQIKLLILAVYLVKRTNEALSYFKLHGIFTS